MRWKLLLSWIVTLLILFLLIFYFIFLFFPYSIDFSLNQSNGNFSISAKGSEDMQFYPKMRFPSTTITYTIIEEDCTPKKIQDMKSAFSILEDQTSLNFFEMNDGGQIVIVCDSKARIEDGLFIAGEGEPSNVTQTPLYNVISRGNILLLREDRCPTPTIALHELLHVLGFDHSENKNNIMYPITNCKQILGEDITLLLDELYKTPSYPDLAFQNVSASFSGNYFYTNVQIINQGLMESKNSVLVIYGDDKEIENIDIENLDYGYGRVITYEKLLVSKRYEKIEYVIVYDDKEINKENNIATLTIKK